jgi:RNA polymerase sigma-70 factor, ECF subfamily
MTEAPLEQDREDAERLRKGDLSGLDGLMRRHQDRLLRYLQRLLGDPTLAEDLFQQAWLHVAERIRRYDAERPFVPWLLTVARNLALDHLRRYRPDSLEDGPEPAVPAAGGPSPGPDPLAHTLAAERGQRVAVALRELGVHEREMLCLRFEQDLALSQIAEVLGVPLPTAKARLYRALSRLRGRLLAQAPAEEWT